MTEYNHSEIEKKWQKKWEEDGMYVPDISKANKPYYNLWMFPYPSGEGLHVGHAYASTASDIHGRFKRMQGFEVFQPIGYDSFGIHAENFAIKIGETPQKMLARTTKNYERQLKSLGHGYDWTRTVTTSNIDYYRWTQWLFIQMFKAGLAYRGKANVNWCPKCKTVLSDEQVITGKCERCESETEKKLLEQWFFKITAYAEKLLAGHAQIDWPKKLITAQQNWIGKSEGHLIEFSIFNPELVEGQFSIKVFTTRPETLNSATFLALAPDYPGLLEILTPEKRLEIAKFTNSKEKFGVFTDLYAENPLTSVKIPVWIANYVSADYGTGAIMGVPGYDERDRDFALKYHIDILKITASSDLRGIPQTVYHLRDWLISRQRYWGPPIPMINCPKCGWQPVPEKDLPVVLPNISDFQPEGEGKGPLAKHSEFYETVCPKCGDKATRETDVSDTFLDSAWYYLRYPSVGIKDAPWDPKITKKWLPVDMYTGGMEHANLHLLYVRFVTIALHDMGFIDFAEPMKRFFAHGLIIKDGAKMSKSKGNVVNPDEYIAKYGADALRLYLMFMGPVSEGGDFRDTGMEGMYRWVRRVYSLIGEQLAISNQQLDAEIEKLLHKLIKKATEAYEARKYNTVISGMMEFINLVEKKQVILPKQAWKVFLQILFPLAPHLTSELYPEVASQLWPEFDRSKLLDDQVTVVVQVDNKVRDRLIIETNMANNEDYVKQSATSSAKIQNFLKTAKFRTIFIPGKLINLVHES